MLTHLANRISNIVFLCKIPTIDIWKLDSLLTRKLVHVRNLNLNMDDDVEEFFLYRPYFTIVLVDLDCRQSEIILQKTSEMELLNGTRHFVLFSRNYSSSIGKMNGLKLNLQSKVLLVVVASEAAKTVAEIYKVSGIPSLQRRNGTEIVINAVGSYSSRYKVLKLAFNSSIAANLEGIRLSVCTYVSRLLYQLVVLGSNCRLMIAVATR